MRELLDKLRMYGPVTFAKYALYEIYLNLWMHRVRNSYSQGGEDIVIDGLLKNKQTGFYVDVGANDPVRFSNTNRFYSKGWTGINIEPDPECFKRIADKRKRDINLNLGVGDTNAKLTFYKFSPHTLSTFSKADVAKYIKWGFKLLDKIKVPVRRLSDILDEYAPNKKVDFLSIDTEGYDLEVLKSNNWKKFRPKVVCIESTEQGEDDLRMKNSLEEFLKDKGYRKTFDNNINCIYTI